MNELIKREDAINAVAELQGIAQSKAELTGISKAWKRIKALQTVDAVPVEWIKNHIREQVECDNRTYAMTIRAMLDWYELNCADGERIS